MLTNKTITSQVIRGMGKGNALGFPTINLAYGKLELPFGVYAAKVYTQTGVFFGALHFGPISIFGILKPSLEVHLLDFEGDLYGQKVRVEILKKIRKTKDFSTVESLKKQLADDVKKIKMVVKIP